MTPPTQTEDFVLSLVRKVGDTYLAIVLRSPAGETQDEFELPFTTDELAVLFGAIGYTRKATRGADSPEVQNARKVGERLFNSVFSGRIRDLYQRSIGSHGGLRIRLRLQEVPELVGLPWELMFDAGRNHFLLLEGQSTLVRHLPVQERVEPLRVNLPLRILVAISNPATSQYPSLDVEQEWANLALALQPLVENRSVMLQRIVGATPKTLLDTLRNGDCHVLHFVGHGGYDKGVDEGFLALEDGNGGVAPVHAGRLSKILRVCPSLRLVVLNACEGGRASNTDMFAGVAQALVQGAIPAVVAMQFPITDAAAVVFAGQFYKGIANGLPVDLALTESRSEVDLHSDGGIEWATPVLYMRGDGELFNVSDKPAPLPVSEVPLPTPVIAEAVVKDREAPTPPEKPEPKKVEAEHRSNQPGKSRFGLIAAVLGLLVIGVVVFFQPNRPEPRSDRTEVEASPPNVPVEAQPQPRPQTLPEPEKLPTSVAPTAGLEKPGAKTETPSLSAGNIFKDCDVCPEMVVIPAGSFDMGSNNGDADEKSVHRVTLAKPFALGKTEVTQGQWKAIMGTNPSYFSICGDSCPVENVSWNDTKEFIRKLNAKTGKQYRLPSEAEWEYACRGGAHQEYCGSDSLDSVAWYGYEKSDKTPHPVAGKQANGFGLYDMSGNVWEWVEDSYHDSYSRAPTDGSAWQGDGAKRVLRGGSWYNKPRLARAALRNRDEPAYRNGNFGFRVARMLP